MIFMQKYVFLSKVVQNTEGYAKEGLYHFERFLMLKKGVLSFKKVENLGFIILKAYFC